MPSEYVFTSESVTEGHPDKLCDQISDALVDHYLLQDPQSRIIAECAVSTGILFVSVKAASEAVVDVPHTARQVILDVGYTSGNFNGKTCTVMTNLSDAIDGYPRIEETTLDEHALDQWVAQDNVTVFGYACSQTPVLLPLPIWLANCLVRQMDHVRRETLPYLTPDGKCQVGVVFRDHRPTRIHSLTLVTSQLPSAPPPAKLHDDLLEHVVMPVCADEGIAIDHQTRITINPEGPMQEGGPALHAGLTGRKNGVDTYGGFARHSGSALSGKDPLRVDRIAAYAARFAAKNVVAAGLAEVCEVQLSYSIGLAKPVSMRLDTFGTGTISDTAIAQRLQANFDFRLGGIIRRFELRDWPARRPAGFYRILAAYGQVGRLDMELPWENTDLAEALR